MKHSILKIIAIVFTILVVVGTITTIIYTTIIYPTVLESTPLWMENVILIIRGVLVLGIGWLIIYIINKRL